MVDVGFLRSKNTTATMHNKSKMVAVIINMCSILTFYSQLVTIGLSKYKKILNKQVVELKIMPKICYNFV